MPNKSRYMRTRAEAKGLLKVECLLYEGYKRRLPNIYHISYIIGEYRVRPPTFCDKCGRERCEIFRFTQQAGSRCPTL